MGICRRIRESNLLRPFRVMDRGLVLRKCGVLGVLLLSSTLAPAQEQGDVQSLFDRGLSSFMEGNLDGAVAAFEKAFALNPSSDAMMSFVERATTAKIYEMVRSSDPKIAGVGLQLLKSARTLRVAKVQDPKQIRQAIEEVFQAQDQERLVRMVRHTATFGRNLVPFLVPYLGDTDLSRRTTAINWVARIGLDGVPVLQAARKHPSAIVRRNVAYLLGAKMSRHAVSLGTLKAMMETDSAEEVKAAAAEAFASILADLDGQGKELAAKEYFLESAYRQYYLNPYRNPFAASYYIPTVYKLVGDQIVGETVAEFQLSERMAQQALEEALELDPSFLEARVLTLCCDAKQVCDYDANAAYYAKDETHAEVKGILAKQAPYVNLVLRNRLLAPAEVLYEGLMQALDDGKAEVSRKIMEVIRETSRRGRVPESLLKALEDSNSRLVRTDAAITIAYWNPLRDFDAGEPVVDILADAVVSSGIRTVQKVMGDQQGANRFDEIFRGLNMESYSPIDNIEEGYDTVVKSPPDVVFIDELVKMSVVKPGVAPINFFVTELRKNYRSSNVPVVVVAPASKLEAAKTLYESEERKVWVVPDTIDRLALDNTVFSKIFKGKDDAKAQATKLAKLAADAIEYLASVPTRIPVKNAVPELLKVLKNRPDEVRIPCIKALGALRATEAVSQLTVLYANPENSKEVRIEAMRAAGRALAATTGGAGEAVLKVVRKGMEDADADLRKVCWFAFSNCGAESKVQYEALLAQAPAASSAPKGAETEVGDQPPAPEEGTEAAEDSKAEPEEGAKDAKATAEETSESEESSESTEAPKETEKEEESSAEES